MAKRICIYPRDVMTITGRSERYSRSIIKEIKGYYNKQKRQLVTIYEFCDYMGFEVEEIIDFIN